jgi:hypothetical protein
VRLDAAIMAKVQHGYGTFEENGRDQAGAMAMGGVFLAAHDARSARCGQGEQSL